MQTLGVQYQRPDYDEMTAPPERRFRFSLITLIVAVNVLGVLLWAAIRYWPFGPNIQTKRGHVTAMIDRLDFAIRQFTTDHKRLPWAATGVAGQINSQDVIRELMPTNSKLIGKVPSINTTRRYLRMPKRFTKVTNSGMLLVDSWGNEFCIYYDWPARTIMIWSLGENGRDDTLDGDNNYGDDIHAQ